MAPRTTLKFLPSPANSYTLRIALRRLIIMAIDSTLIAFSFVGAFALRLRQHELLLTYMDESIPLLALAILLGIPTLYATGWYRGLTRYVGSLSLYGLLPRSALMVVILLSTATIIGIKSPPRSFWLLYWILFTICAIGIRIILRDVLLIRLEKKHYQVTKESGAATLIYGAGSSGVALFMALRGEARFRVIGFIDDDPTLHGRTLQNLTIWDPLKVSKIIKQRDITQVLLAIPSIDRNRKRLIVDHLTHKGLKVMSIPSLRQLATGQKHVSDLSAVKIEDLLGREPTSGDQRLLERSIRSKVVLVTGAGGSIGSELCRQVISLGAKHLIMLERNEFSLYSIDKELESFLLHPLLRPDTSNIHYPANGNKALPTARLYKNAFESIDESNKKVAYVPDLHQRSQFPIRVLDHRNWTPCLGDACDETQVTKICRDHGVEVIFHAAAYKHVPMVEANLCVGVFNNIMATASVIKSALNCDVKQVTLISTDKAVRPTNAMGASKRICEMLIQSAAINQAKDDEPIFSMVRFGNVLGSSGSVIPLFHSQIAAGGPVTVTHPEITRYFMTIPEAVALVVQAAGLGTGGDLFILDMGAPVRIADLARQMIELSGYRVRDSLDPNGDLEIIYTGLRPGEKLYEELLISSSSIRTEHPLIMRAVEPPPLKDSFHPSIQALLTALKSLNHELSSDIMHDLVPEYTEFG